VGQLGRNAHGQVLKPGRVLDCYLGLLVDRADDGRGAVVLVVAPAALLHLGVPQPDGTVLYELLTGHPDRTPGQLVFLADLTVELRAWPTDTWPRLASTRRRPPTRSSPPGTADTSGGCGWTD
jgi:hypothetical protein